MPQKSMQRRRRAKRTATVGMTTALSKYLATNKNVQRIHMPLRELTREHILTANGIYSYNSTANGAAGYVLPEHPGRSLVTFNAASGAGVIQNTQWTHYAALYDEFRVVATIVEFMPSSQTFSTQVEMYTLVDYDNELGAGSLTGSGQAARYQTARLLSPTQESQFVAHYPMSGRAFPQWQSTAVTTARGSVYTFLNAGANSTIFGPFQAKWVVQFRALNG